MVRTGKILGPWLFLAIPIVLVIAMAIIILGPNVGSHPLSPSAKCRCRLWMIGTAIDAYMDDRRKSPTSLPGDANAYPSYQDLINAKYLFNADFKCSEAQRRIKPPRDCDYFYLPPLPNSPEGTIIACDLYGNHEEGRGILFVAKDRKDYPLAAKDHTCLCADFFKSPDDRKFQAMLQETPANQRFAKALAEYERKLGLR